MPEPSPAPAAVAAPAAPAPAAAPTPASPAPGTTADGAPSPAPVAPTAPTVRAPEKYSWTAPDGAAPLAEPEVIAAIEPLARVLDLSQEGAVKLLTRLRAANTAEVTAQKEAYIKLQGDWLGEVKADKVLGGENFDKTMHAVDAVVTNFGGDEFRAFLKETGIAHNPVVVKFLHAIAQKTSEDTFTKGKDSASSTVTPADFFPNSKMN